MTARQAGEALARLTARPAPVAAASRQVLLGSRDPAEGSCVRPAVTYDHQLALRPFPRDPDGGVGTRTAAFWMSSRRRSAVEDHAWQQTTFRGALDRLLAQSRAASGEIEPLRQDARRIAAACRGWAALPKELLPAAGRPVGDWAGVCLQQLNEAVARRDLAAARHGSAELEAALFALADLHRWAEFLLSNHLEVLDFQAEHPEMSTWTDQTLRAHGRTYSFDVQKDGFAASALIYGLLKNLLEVERQAEQWFAPPAEWRTAGPAPGAERWLPPSLRGSFTFLRGVLSPANREQWDRAAASPYERSFLANMLYRATRSRAVPDLAVVLRRFDRARPKASVPELMDVIFYRGEPCGGAVWNDRFEPRLMQAAGRLPGTPAAALRGAREVVHDILADWSNYKGHVWSLRSALDRGELDCVRGSDMIGTLYRNAGRTGVYWVHLSCGVTTHSLTAAEVDVNGRRQVVVADPFPAADELRAWPAAFFGSYTWPAGYPGDMGPAFTAELCARGLDNYVFAEAYIVRGEDAGTLVRAVVPYLPGRDRSEARKVFAGPYPKALAPTEPHAAAGGPRKPPAPAKDPTTNG